MKIALPALLRTENKEIGNQKKSQQSCPRRNSNAGVRRSNGTGFARLVLWKKDELSIFSEMPMEALAVREELTSSRLGGGDKGNSP